MEDKKLIEEIITELRKINANLELSRQGWLHKTLTNCKRCRELKQSLKKLGDKNGR